VILKGTVCLPAIPPLPSPPREKGTERNGTLILKKDGKNKIKRDLRHVASGNREGGGFFFLSHFFPLCWIGLAW